MTGTAESVIILGGEGWGMVKMEFMEFVFVLWGTKIISRLLWLYFPNPVLFRHAPSFGETLSYGLQAKSIGEHLKKTEIMAETFCLAPALLQWLKGACVRPWFVELSLGVSCPLLTSTHHLACAWKIPNLYQQVQETVLHVTNLIYLKKQTKRDWFGFSCKYFLRLCSTTATAEGSMNQVVWNKLKNSLLCLLW